MEKIKLNTTFRWGSKLPKMEEKMFDNTRVLVNEDGDKFISTSLDALFKAYADFWYHEIIGTIEPWEWEEYGLEENKELWKFCKEVALRDSNSIFEIKKLKDKTLYTLSIN